jgi:hypothetical protein
MALLRTDKRSPPISELATKHHQLHPNQMNQWRRQARPSTSWPRTFDDGRPMRSSVGNTQRFADFPGTRWSYLRLGVDADGKMRGAICCGFALGNQPENVVRSPALSVVCLAVLLMSAGAAFAIYASGLCLQREDGWTISKNWLKVD